MRSIFIFRSFQNTLNTQWLSRKEYYPATFYYLLLVFLTVTLHFVYYSKLILCTLNGNLFLFSSLSFLDFDILPTRNLYKETKRTEQFCSFLTWCDNQRCSQIMIKFWVVNDKVAVVLSLSSLMSNSRIW